MAVICLNCGYEMSTSQEITSTAVHVVFAIFSILKGSASQNAVAGIMNHPKVNVRCPNCGEKGRWEDIRL